MSWRVGEVTSLWIDLGEPGAVVSDGDWVASSAGARYLVVSARAVRSRSGAPRNRWAMRVMRLDRNTPVPDDVVCWWMHWYPRTKTPR